MTTRAGKLDPLQIPSPTLRLLGGPAAVATRGAAVPRDATGRVVLKYAAVSSLSRVLGVSEPKLMRVVDVNERTAQRRREQGALTAEESDRLARVARVTQRAIEAFGDPDRAKAWLARPNRALQGLPPLDLLGTDAGAECVADELGRIEHGELF